ncbi:MAG: YkgJ family cysteine cluster protein [archaeon]
MGQRKLSQKEESDICLSCGECCKRYWITILPSESKAIAKTLKISEKDFLEKHCIFQAKLFPKSTPGVLTYPSTFFPRRVYNMIRHEMPGVSESFFIVQQIVLKREEAGGKKICNFLDSQNYCAIYKVRPKPCDLFPFIAMPDIRESYPFCGLFKKTFKDTSKDSKKYYALIQAYFKQVDKKGLGGVWKNLPKKGLLFLGDKELGEISLEELSFMTPFRDKTRK